MSYDPIVAAIGAVLLAAIWLLAQYGNRHQRVQPARDRTWIDQRIATERDPARRQAWRTIREREEQ